MISKNIEHELYDFLAEMLAVSGSDLIITAGSPPTMKCKGDVIALRDKALTPEEAKAFTFCIMNDKQKNEFEMLHECNFAISPPNLGRFRVNAYRQQNCCGLVMRVIAAQIPTIEGLGLPDVLKDIMMAKNGLIIMVGSTGSGKSTSMAAMIDHRNENSRSHIITLEDPIEYVHKPKNCVLMQREIGVDSHTWENALQNTLRQAPDVILLGEIRSEEVMSTCLELAQTGHLVLATLHANNSNQAIDRILGLFPNSTHKKLLQDISMNLRAIISQRLIKTPENTRCVAIEILLNSPLMQDLIAKGDTAGMKALMAKSRELGMQTFDQAIFDLYKAKKIDYEQALQNADSANEVRLNIKLTDNDDVSEMDGWSLRKKD
ncbi:MAG: PilT/PilU family type 4a pilus ATPase [Methylococcaceae bacterium]